MFLLPLCMILGAAVVILIWLAFQEQYGSFFVIFLLGAIVFLVPLVFFGYRLFALLRARYVLERDGLHLHWGLRAESIPLPDVICITSISELKYDLPLPRFIFPGVILGNVHTPKNGDVEFISSEISQMLLVSTRKKTFVISPARKEEFIKDFQYNLELGSLSPIESSSTLPAGFLRAVFKDKIASSLIFGGLFVTLGLLATVSLLIPGAGTISLGFSPSGLPLEKVSASRLLLLPLLCIISYLIGLVTGIFFYARTQNRIIAYTLWGASVITPILLLVSLIFII